MDMHTQKFKVRLGLFIAGGLMLFIIAIFIIGKQKNLINHNNQRHLSSITYLGPINLSPLK